MKITVILTSKNRKYETRRGLDSVYTQTRKADEIILILDHCCDDIKNYLSKLSYPKLNVITVPSSDISSSGHARNIGIGKATGDYIAFLDSDDYWQPSKLECFESEVLKNDMPDIVFSQVRFHNDGNSLIIPNLKEGCDSFINQAYSQNICFASAAMYRHDLLVENNGFDEKMKTQCDWDFFIRCAESRNIRAVYIQIPLTDMWVMYNSGCFDKQEWKNEYEQLLHRCKKQIISCGNSYFSYKAYHMFFSSGVPEEKLITDFLEILDDDVDCLKLFLKEKIHKVDLMRVELDKKQSFYLLMRNWTKLYQSKRTVSDILRSHNISEVAIYGYGIHGHMLMEDLKNNNIPIKYIIDQKNENATDSLPVFHMEDNLPDVEAIIVTPYLDRKELEHKLKYLNAHIIWLDQLINDSLLSVGKL